MSLVAPTRSHGSLAAKSRSTGTLTAPDRSPGTVGSPTYETLTDESDVALSNELDEDLSE